MEVMKEEEVEVEIEEEEEVFHYTFLSPEKSRFPQGEKMRCVIPLWSPENTQMGPFTRSEYRPTEGAGGKKRKRERGGMNGRGRERKGGEGRQGEGKRGGGRKNREGREKRVGEGRREERGGGWGVTPYRVCLVIN